MQWSNFFHIYQPPQWNEAIIRTVTDQAYRPMLAILKNHPQVKITLHIAGSLTEQLQALGLHDVIDDIKILAGRGQIELVGGVMYHAILPLLPLEEAKRQITLQHTFHQEVFGPVYQPQGFFPPEMAYSPDLDALLLELGFRWVIVDEPSDGGPLGEHAFAKKYQSSSGLGFVFRHRTMSDFLSFSANIQSAPEVAATMLRDERSQKVLVTGMDGENLGHHRHDVDKLWEYLVTRPQVTTATISEQLAGLGDPVTIKPIASSWSAQPEELAAGVPYGLWNHPDNPIHQLQWKLTNRIITTVQQLASDASGSAVRKLLDQALTSDKYWWASASPWWDMTIVLRETQKLADVISPLADLSPAIKNEVAQLMEEISHTVELWETSGIAKQRQNTYLAQTGNVHYMSGNKV